MITLTHHLITMTGKLSASMSEPNLTCFNWYIYACAYVHVAVVPIPYT